MGLYETVRAWELEESAMNRGRWRETRTFRLFFATDANPVSSRSKTLVCFEQARLDTFILFRAEAGLLFCVQRCIVAKVKVMSGGGCGGECRLDTKVGCAGVWISWGK